VKFKSSLYFVKDMKAGVMNTADCIRNVRPRYGLPPKMIDRVVGAMITQCVAANTPITNNMFTEK
jgi:N-acetylneuraminate synthase